MKALVWHGAHDLRIEERPTPKVGPGQVLIEMKAVGICGSDLKLYKYGVLGTLEPSEPFVMGHEGTGRVIEVGAGVDGLAIGDRVCINPQASCYHCFYCHRGEHNLCENLDFKSVTGDGVFSEYVIVRADQAIPLPENIDFVAGTVIEPLSIAVQAVRLANMQRRDTVVILGVGTIGLLSLSVARALGVRRIIAVDVRPFALELAAKMGALMTINNEAQNSIQAMEELSGGLGPDVVLEMAGNRITQAQAIAMVRPGGSVVMVGIGPDATVSMNVNRIVRSNLRIFGSVRTSGDAFITAVSLVETGQVDVSPLISCIFPFEEAMRAFAFAADRGNKAIKCVMTFDEG